MVVLVAFVLLIVVFLCVYRFPQTRAPVPGVFLYVSGQQKCVCVSFFYRGCVLGGVFSQQSQRPCAATLCMCALCVFV